MVSRLLKATIFALLVIGVSARNRALEVNPPTADAHLTTRGSDWLWAVFAVMAASALGVTAWTLTLHPGRRAFHWIGVAILFTAALSYFSMASNLGHTPIRVEFVRYRGNLFSDRAINPYTRAIWYVRYIDWVITTPLLLLELLLATGMPLGGIFITIFFDLFMIIAGLVGALVASTYKWGYFTFGCVAMLYIFWTLLMPARANARALSPTVHKIFLASAGYLVLIWLCYPICWAVSDGGNVIPTDSEMIYYGILDLLAKPAFLAWHLFALRKVDYEAFQLQSGHYSATAANAYGTTGTGINEKRPLGASTPGAGNLTGATGSGAVPGTGVGVPGAHHHQHNPQHHQTGNLNSGNVAPTGDHYAGHNLPNAGQATTGYPSTGTNYNTNTNTNYNTNTTGTTTAHNVGVGAHGMPGTGTQGGIMHPVSAGRPSDATVVA